MAKVQRAILRYGLALILTLSAVRVGAQEPDPKFFPDDPVWRVPPSRPVKDASVRQISDTYDSLYYSFAHYPVAKRSREQKYHTGAINTLGEVPDGAWYTNRHWLHPMTLEHLAQGCVRSQSPDELGQWTIVSAKARGVTPGFTAEDAQGVKYLMKFDPPEDPELASAADVIGSRFLHALGYHVPEYRIVRVRHDQLVLGKGAVFRAQGHKERPMIQADILEVLKGQPVDHDGRYRILVSRIIDGKALGPFRFTGVRSDDPNDVVPHEVRRELRGYYVFCSWLNHDDSRDVNSLDALVSEGGISYIKHYLIDFGATLGSASYGPDDARAGFEYLFEGKQAMIRMASLGLYVPRWYRDVEYPHLRSVGRFESKLFEPERWKPTYPNVAFDQRDPEDEFWAAKQVMAFTDEQIRAIVRTGEYSDPRAREWVSKCLIERRDKIGRTYFAKVLPLDGFAVREDRLVFTDLAVKYGFRQTRAYSVHWSRFDNQRRTENPVSGSAGFEFPSRIRDAEDGDFYLATITAPEQGQKVMVYLRHSQGRFQVVGVERSW